MNKKNKITVIIFLISLLFICSAALFFWLYGPENNFECRARVYSSLDVTPCGKNNAYDFFLSMYNDGQGYLLIAGNYSCRGVEKQKTTGIVKFNYHKEGSYYSMHLEGRKPELIKLMDMLKFDEIKLKITRIDHRDYILSTPIETLMICTKEN